MIYTWAEFVERNRILGEQMAEAVNKIRLEKEKKAKEAAKAPPSRP